MHNDDALLLRVLNDQRNGVLAVVEGLADDALRRPVLPSGWHCLGLFQHLTINERYWMRWAVGGEQIPMHYDDMVDNDWVVAPGLDAETVFGRYRADVEAANEVISSIPFSDAPRNVDPNWDVWFRRTGPVDSVRWIVLHMIEETARHAGHLDAVRELLDGRTAL